MKRNLIIILASAFTLIAILVYQTSQVSDKRLHVVFCDVGQGDAIYIRTPGSIDILVDGGRGSEVSDCLAKHMPLWDKKIELVFATHPDADHIGGLLSVVKGYRIGEFNTVDAEKDTKVYSELIDLLQENKIPVKSLTSGSKFTLSDGVMVATLWPPPRFSSDDTNEYSLVQLLSFGDFDLLLTGDVTSQILDGLDLGGRSIEVIKLPHHGSKTGVDSSTFEKIKAKLAIISAGKNNSYHHPHPSILALLKRFGIDYKRTDEIGSIEVITDGRNTKVVN